MTNNQSDELGGNEEPIKIVNNRRISHKLFDFLLSLFWIAGVVLAKGFLSTFFAVFIPFWAWYLVVEKLLLIAGVN